MPGWYAKWMTQWETELTTRDTNRVVRPLEWGFEWLRDFGGAGEGGQVLVSGAKAQIAFGAAMPGLKSRPISGTRASVGAGVSAVEEDTPGAGRTGVVAGADDAARMIALNQEIVRRSDDFFGYQTPTDFRIEQRHPQLFPTNVRPETLAQDAEMKRAAAAGELEPAEFLRFTSAVRTGFPENDQMNARWYPAQAHKDPARPKQAIIVMPQWNADAISHNALCKMFNRFGVSALRLSMPYHDIRRPAELERSDYATSANIGRTIAACRQAVVDVRSSMDWLETQGYTQFGVLGTSLGSCYAFIAAAHDPRLKVCAFNHASTWFGDVVWEGQSTRHVHAAFEEAGLTQDVVRQALMGISPMSYMERFAATPKRVLVVYAKYDLTFPLHLSLEVLKNFDRCGIDYVPKMLPCGHYTTGETPYKYIDGWYLGSFIYQAFKELRENK